MNVDETRVCSARAEANFEPLIDDFWNQACRALDLSVAPADLDMLLSHYMQPHRHYHTVQHLSECIGQLPLLGLDPSFFGEVVLALFFHDAIYDVLSKDNEIRSAEMAYQFVIAHGGARPVASQIKDLVIATRHIQPALELDAQILVDIDLSILGCNRDRFDEYELQVREEYKAVPWHIYREGRMHVLLGFLTRSQIFATKYFRLRYESKARSNITRSIERLKRQPVEIEG